MADPKLNEMFSDKEIVSEAFNSDLYHWNGGYELLDGEIKSDFFNAVKDLVRHMFDLAEKRRHQPESKTTKFGLRFMEPGNMLAVEVIVEAKHRDEAMHIFKLMDYRRQLRLTSCWQVTEESNQNDE